MKIIKPGTTPDKFWWIGKRFSCGGCYCEFEMEVGDYHSNTDVFIYNCPACKRSLRIRKPIVSNDSKTSLFDDLFGNDGVFGTVFGKRL